MGPFCRGHRWSTLCPKSALAWVPRLTVGPFCRGHRWSTPIPDRGAGGRAAGASHKDALTGAAGAVAKLFDIDILNTSWHANKRPEETSTACRHIDSQYARRLVQEARGNRYSQMVRISSSSSWLLLRDHIHEHRVCCYLFAVPLLYAVFLRMITGRGQLEIAI